MSTRTDPKLQELQTTLQRLKDEKDHFEQELAEKKTEKAEAERELRAGSKDSGVRKGFFGSLFGTKADPDESPKPKPKETIDACELRIKTLIGLIEQRQMDSDRAIDAYLMDTDDHYRVSSMRWDAVMRLKHSLELYDKDVLKAAKSIKGVQDEEVDRQGSGLRVRSESELLAHISVVQAFALVKDGYDGFGKAIEDVAEHNKQVSCVISITYHGGSMRFDIYKHPDHLSLYGIETLENALYQLDGLHKAILAALHHVEMEYNRTIAEKLRYRNRLNKTLLSS